jgi:hypothetical protein
MSPIKQFRFGALLLVSTHGAFAADSSMCSLPPYGDTPEKYQAMAAEFFRAAAASPKLPPTMLLGQFESAMVEACKAKFEHGSRTTYYRNGISDRQIGELSTTELAAAWFNARNAALAQEIPSSPPPTTLSRTTPPPGDDGPRVFALFQCVLTTGECTLQGAPRMSFAGAIPGELYRTLADCEHHASLASGGHKPDMEGRFHLNPMIWYECRSKRLDTWDPAK